MNKVKHNNQQNTVLIVMNTLIGAALWVLIAAIMSWLTLSERLSESSMILIAPLVQGVIAYVITTISFFSRRGRKVITSLIAPFGYLILQFVVSLLFWETSLSGIIRGCVAVICGAALSLITYNLKWNARKSKAVLRYSR